jgi:urease accessory protein
VLIESSAPVRDLAWCSPKELPDEIKEFGNDVDGGLGVGAAGKLGVLDLTLARSGGATRVHRQYQRSPLYIYRPVYLDKGRPDMAFIFVQQSGDGIVQGDRYRIDVSCSDGSAAHVTSQAATKVFGARCSYASQLVHLEVGAGAVLEYLPDPVIPFQGARLFQRTTARVHPGSTLILGETVLPGRVAHGESHDYDFYWSETQVMSEDGDLLFSDLLRLVPQEEHPRSPALLGGFDVLASLFFITAGMNPASLTSTLRASLSDLPTAIAGVSELPNRCGVGVRVLAPTSKSAQSAVNSAWDAARRVLLGTTAPDLRKG